MAWHRLVAPFALPCSLVIALACNGSSGEEGADFDAGQFPTTGEETTSTTASSTATATATGSGSGSTAATEATSVTGDSTAAADSTTAPLEPVECGDLMCDPGQVCVVPCCGGPQPGCYEMPRGGDCGTDTPDMGGVECCQNAGDPVMCMKMQWCIPGPCMADPPYCTPAETISCNDSQCTAEGGCYGMLLEDGHLQCSCK